MFLKNLCYSNEGWSDFMLGHQLTFTVNHKVPLQGDGPFSCFFPSTTDDKCKLEEGALLFKWDWSMLDGREPSCILPWCIIGKLNLAWEGFLLDPVETDRCMEVSYLLSTAVQILFSSFPYSPSTALGWSEWKTDSAAFLKMVLSSYYMN